VISIGIRADDRMICQGVLSFDLRTRRNGVSPRIRANHGLNSRKPRIFEIEHRFDPTCQKVCDKKSARQKLHFLETSKMAKYYIQSGQVSYIVGACDVEGAALWVMHRIMDEKICDHEDALLSQGLDPFAVTEFDSQIEGVPQAVPYEAMLEGLAEFDETILISQIGFGRSDSGELETEEIFHHWRQLMLAVDRLHDRLG
jgi:hypothetical protein